MTDDYFARRQLNKKIDKHLANRKTVPKGELSIRFKTVKQPKFCNHWRADTDVRYGLYADSKWIMWLTSLEVGVLNRMGIGEK